MEYEGMNWVMTYLMPPALIGYAIRVEWMFRRLNTNQSGQEMVHYMKWLAEQQTGKKPPPYIP